MLPLEKVRPLLVERISTLAQELNAVDAEAKHLKAHLHEMRDWAIRQIQRVWRGRTARQLTDKRRIVLQHNYEQRSALVLQRVFRGHMERHAYRTADHRRFARNMLLAQIIQRVFRGSLARKRASILRNIKDEEDRTAAATTIQATFRGSKARAVVRKIQEKLDAEAKAEHERDAAVNIQKTFRGYTSRRVVVNRKLEFQLNARVQQLCDTYISKGNFWDFLFAVNQDYAEHAQQRMQENEMASRFIELVLERRNDTLHAAWDAWDRVKTSLNGDSVQEAIPRRGGIHYTYAEQGQHRAVNKRKLREDKRKLREEQWNRHARSSAHAGRKLEKMLATRRRQRDHTNSAPRRARTANPTSMRDLHLHTDELLRATTPRGTAAFVTNIQRLSSASGSLRPNFYPGQMLTRDLLGSDSVERLVFQAALHSVVPAFLDAKAPKAAFREYLTMKPGLQKSAFEREARKYGAQFLPLFRKAGVETVSQLYNVARISDLGVPKAFAKTLHHVLEHLSNGFTSTSRMSLKDSYKALRSSEGRLTTEQLSRGNRDAITASDQVTSREKLEIKKSNWHLSTIGTRGYGNLPDDNRKHRNDFLTTLSGRAGFQVRPASRQLSTAGTIGYGVAEDFRPASRQLSSAGTVAYDLEGDAFETAAHTTINDRSVVVKDNLTKFTTMKDENTSRGTRSGDTARPRTSNYEEESRIDILTIPPQVWRPKSQKAARSNGVQLKFRTQRSTGPRSSTPGSLNTGCSRPHSRPSTRGTVQYLSDDEDRGPTLLELTHNDDVESAPSEMQRDDVSRYDTDNAALKRRILKSLEPTSTEATVDHFLLYASLEALLGRGELMQISCCEGAEDERRVVQTLVKRAMEIAAPLSASISDDHGSRTIQDLIDLDTTLSKLGVPLSMQRGVLPTLRKLAPAATITLGL